MPVIHLRHESTAERTEHGRLIDINCHIVQVSGDGIAGAGGAEKDMTLHCENGVELKSQKKLSCASCHGPHATELGGIAAERSQLPYGFAVRRKGHIHVHGVWKDRLGKEVLSLE